MCSCLSDMRKRLEENGFEDVFAPIEYTSGRAYLSFLGKKVGKKKEQSIPVLLSKCPICGEPYENKGDTKNANPPIKKKWFDMILSGEKKEEYRNINEYYEKRFMNLFGMVGFDGQYIKVSESGFKEDEKDDIQLIKFRNGYSKNSLSFIAKCTLSVGTGKEEWGAEKDNQYFILAVHEILKGSE